VYDAFDPPKLWLQLSPDDVLATADAYFVVPLPSNHRVRPASGLPPSRLYPARSFTSSLPLTVMLVPLHSWNEVPDSVRLVCNPVVP